MTRTDILRAAVEGFRNQQRRLQASISEIEAELNGIVASANGAAPASEAATVRRKRRRVSPEGRGRMRAGQRRRWAAIYAQRQAA